MALSELLNQDFNLYGTPDDSQTGQSLHDEAERLNEKLQSGEPLTNLEQQQLQTIQKYGGYEEVDGQLQVRPTSWWQEWGPIVLAAAAAFGGTALAGAMVGGDSAAGAEALAAEGDTTAAGAGATADLSAPVLGDVGPGIAGIGGGDVGPGIAPGAFGPGVTTGASTGSTLNQISGLGKTLAGLGKSIGAAGTAAGQNALNQEQLALEANRANITGEQAYQEELMARAAEEDAQRQTALKNAGTASFETNFKGSPYAPGGVTPLSPAYASTLASIAKQSKDQLSTPSTSLVSNMAPPTPYTPIPPGNVQGATNTRPSTLSNIATGVGTGLAVGGGLAQLGSNLGWW